jgi:hypothetical protein
LSAPHCLDRERTIADRRHADALGGRDCPQ